MIPTQMLDRMLSRQLRMVLATSGITSDDLLAMADLLDDYAARTENIRQAIIKGHAEMYRSLAPYYVEVAA